MTAAPPTRITGVHPLWAVEGGRILISGDGFPVEPSPPIVRVGDTIARLATASSRRLIAVVPSGLEGGHTPLRIEGTPGTTAYVDVGAPLATGLHQVDNPAFDRDGNLYVTFSGSRGQQGPVSVFVVRADGSRQPFAVGLPNPTSMAFDPDGWLYVSSRFDGSVHRIAPDGSIEVFVTNVGVACGIAFGPDGLLYVGDRSGSILRVEPGRATVVATLPASVAAFHLAFGPDGLLYVSAPTLASHDCVYRISPSGDVAVLVRGFGRPQGLAFDSPGNLYIVDAVAGDSALYRLHPDRPREMERVVVGGALIGLAFDPRGGLVLASADTVYRLDVPVHGLL